jgi:hypothetical protein
VQAALASALDHPIKGPSLTALAMGKKTAAISVCDITRPAPNWLTLPNHPDRDRAASRCDRGGASEHPWPGNRCYVPRDQSRRARGRRPSLARFNA